MICMDLLVQPSTILYHLHHNTTQKEFHLTDLWQGVWNIEEFFVIIQNIFCHAQGQVCAVNSVFS